MKIELVNTEWFEGLSETDKTKVQVMDAFLKDAYTSENEAEENSGGRAEPELLTSEGICEKLFPAISMTNELVATVMRLMGFDLKYDRENELVVWVLWIPVSAKNAND